MPPDFLMTRPLDHDVNAMSDDSDGEEEQPPAPGLNRPQLPEKSINEFDIDAFTVKEAHVSSLRKTGLLWSLSQGEPKVGESWIGSARPPALPHAAPQASDGGHAALSAVLF